MTLLNSLNDFFETQNISLAQMATAPAGEQVVRLDPANVTKTLSGSTHTKQMDQITFLVVF